MSDYVDGLVIFGFAVCGFATVHAVAMACSWWCAADGVCW